MLGISTHKYYTFIWTLARKKKVEMLTDVALIYEVFLQTC